MQQEASCRHPIRFENIFQASANASLRGASIVANRKLANGYDFTAGNRADVLKQDNEKVVHAHDMANGEQEREPTKYNDEGTHYEKAGEIGKVENERSNKQKAYDSAQGGPHEIKTRSINFEYVRHSLDKGS